MKLALATMAALASCASPAMANNDCAKSDTVYENLYRKYGEQRITVGATDNGAAFEFWASIEADTWTAIATKDGISCLIAEGKGWQFAVPIRYDPA